MAMLANLLDASMDGEMVSRLKFERAIKGHQYQPSVHAAAGDNGGLTAADGSHIRTAITHQSMRRTSTRAENSQQNPQDQPPSQRSILTRDRNPNGNHNLNFTLPPCGLCRPLELLEADDLYDVCETENGEQEDVPLMANEDDASRSDARVDEWLHSNGLGMVGHNHSPEPALSESTSPHTWLLCDLVPTPWQPPPHALIVRRRVRRPYDRV